MNFDQFIFLIIAAVLVLVIVGVSVFEAVPVSLIYLSDLRRRKPFRQLAAQLGYTFEPKWKFISSSKVVNWIAKVVPLGSRSTPEAPDGLVQVPLFETTRPRTRTEITITNVIRGAESGGELLLFDYHATFMGEFFLWLGVIGVLVGKVLRRGGLERREHTVAAFRLPEGGLPAFELSPRPWADTCRRLPGLREVKFDHQEFAVRCVLCGREELAIRGVFTPALRQRLLSGSACSVEGAGPWLVVYRPRGIVDRAELRPFLDEARDIARFFRGAHDGHSGMRAP